MSTRFRLPRTGSDYWDSNSELHKRVYSADTKEAASRLQKHIKECVPHGSKVRVVYRAPSVYGITCGAWYVAVELPWGYEFEA